MDKGKIYVIIIVFIVAILLAIFAGTIADETTKASYAAVTVTNESSITGSNTTGTNLAYDRLDSIVTVENATDQVLNTANYSTSVYDLYNGILRLNADSEFVGDSLNVTYTYRPDGYVRHSTSRTLIDLLPLFFVLGGLLFVISKILKDRDWNLFG